MSRVLAVQSVVDPGGNSHINRMGCWSEILRRSPKTYQDPVLWAWLDIFPALRATNFKSTHYLVILFWLNTLKGNCKSSCCGRFEAEHRKKYQTTFLTPKRYDKCPYSFTWEYPPEMDHLHLCCILHVSKEKDCSQAW